MKKPFILNYKNKIKILNRQIDTLLSFSDNGHTPKEKLKNAPPEIRARVHALLDLRKKIKYQLNHGQASPIPFSFNFSFHRTRITFFSHTSETPAPRPKAENLFIPQKTIKKHKPPSLHGKH